MTRVSREAEQGQEGAWEGDCGGRPLLPSPRRRRCCLAAAAAAAATAHVAHLVHERLKAVGLIHGQL